jgi:hypothetical protein
VPDIPRLAPIAPTSVDGHGAQRSALLSRAPLRDDLDAGDGSHAPGQMIVEAFVLIRDDDQELDAGEGDGRKLGEKLGHMIRAQAMRLARVVEGLSLSEVTGSALSFTPRADRPHCGRLPHRSASPESRGLSQTAWVSPSRAKILGLCPSLSRSG